jgi:hypothetical protein
MSAPNLEIILFFLVHMDFLEVLFVHEEYTHNNR